MLTWFSDNLVNIALCAVLVLIIGLLIYSMVRNKKKGKDSCGGNCTACGACSGCSTYSEKSKIKSTEGTKHVNRGI